MLRRCALDIAYLAANRAAQQYAASTSGMQHLRYAVSVQALHQSSLAYASDLKTQLMNLGPRSLAYERPIQQPAPGVEQSWFTRTMLKIGGYYSRESQLIRGAKLLYEDVVEQSTNKEFFEAMDLEYRFAHIHSMLCVHVWLVLVRLRAEGKDGKELAQMLHENFQEDVEFRVRAEGVRVRIGKHLTDLEQRFYGACMVYDRALKGDGDLAEALLRNVYGLDSGKRKQAELLAKYVQREIACLSMTDSDSFMAGRVKFSTDFLQL